MLKKIGLFIIALGFFQTPAGAALPEAAGLYLSFEQRLVLNYALLAQGESFENKEKILTRAKAYVSTLALQGPEVISVANFAEFLKSFRGEWPETHSLALDMELVEKAGPRRLRMYSSPSPRIQRQIERYLKWQNTELYKMISAQFPQGQEKLVAQWGAELQKVLTSSSLPAIKNNAKLWVFEQSEALLAEHMKELDRVGEKVAEAGFAQQQDPAVRILMQTLLGQYFARLSLDSKKMIVSSFLGGNLLADDMKKFEIMVQNSGTVLQKLLQVVARQGHLPPDVQAVFRTLENSVKSVPWVLVEKILKSESANYKFTYFERKPLGVGTMAQVHRAKINVNGKRHDVVVRFIKPGVETRTEEDRRILMEVAALIDNNPDFIKMQVPKLTPLVDDIVKTVTAEFDQEATKRRQKLGKVYERVVPFHSAGYQTEIEFHVPEIFDAKNKTQFMVQEMVLGGKLDKQQTLFEAAIPELKRVAVEAIARTWAQEALFGSGFYHSDLHPGNFMVHVKEPRIVMNILDFGMGGVISPELQRHSMVLGVGTEILSGDLIGRAFWDLSDKERNQVNERDFKQAIHEKAQRIRRGQEPNISMELWVAFALNKGLGIPYEFVSLNRGMGIVNKLLEDSGSSLDLAKITKSLAKRHPRRVLEVLVLQEKVPLKELIKLGWAEMKNVFQDEAPKQRGFELPKGMRCQSIFL